MKKSYKTKTLSLLPVTLPLLLCNTADLRASILMFEGFETDGEGSRYVSTSTFSDGADDYFTRTDGNTEASGIPAYTGFGGSWFWAAEDIDSTDNPSGQALIDFTEIDLASFSGVTISLDAGAGSSTEFDSSNDFIQVQYRIDAGEWMTALAFENDGASFNTGLYQDLNLDGIGEGSLLGLTLQTFSTSILPVTGSFMDLRIDTVMTGNAEAVAFDNIQVTGVPEPASTALSLAVVTAFFLLFRKPFLPFRENESRA